MKLLLFLSLLPAFVAADAFDDYERLNNAGEDVSGVFTGKALEKHERNPSGIIAFYDAKWSTERPGIGLARYVLHKDDKTSSGWMAFQKKDGKVAYVKWTRNPPGMISIAKYGQAADVGITYAALANGFQELNPVINAVGLLPVSVIKVVSGPLLRKYGNISLCSEVTHMGNNAGWLATGWNVGVLAGLGLGASVTGAGSAYLANRHESLWDCVPRDVWPTWMVRK